MEYALVTFGLLAMVVAFGALWRVLDEGLFVKHALMAASHHLQMVSPGALVDVFLY